MSGRTELSSPHSIPTLTCDNKWEDYDMARCTAPVKGHRSASARADCPACGGRYGRYSGYGSYSPPSYSSPGSSGGGRSSGGFGNSARPRWSPAGSSVAYTPAEVRTLTPVRENVEKRASVPDLRDVFLCHAWDDRGGAAKELHDLLESRGVSVWFSEKDVPLGTPLLREIDKGLVKSRVGIVLVTPALLSRLQREGIADKELSRIFERFYCVDKARSRQLGGTGLGLSIVKHLAYAMGGNVSVESEPGRGSVFRVELPRGQTASPRPRPILARTSS